MTGRRGTFPAARRLARSVSVADGMVALGIGTDTGGSCRVPASYCGIVGYKSSHGRVPLTGCNPLSSSFDSIGPLANTVACCATADAAMAGDGDGPRCGSGRRGAGVVREGLRAHGSAPQQVERDFARALQALTAAGATLTDMAFPELREIPAINAKGGIVAAEAWAVHRARIAATGADYDPRVRGRIEWRKRSPPPTISTTSCGGGKWLRSSRDASRASTALLLPTTLNTPPAIADLAEDKDYIRFNGMSLRNTYVGNFLDGCAISLPRQRRGEAPCGLTVLAPRGRDRDLFGVAAALEGVLEACR